MRILLILSFIISPLIVWGQTDSTNLVMKKTNGMVAIDILAPTYSLFSEKKGLEFLVTYPVYNQIHIAAEIGYEKNKFEDNKWNTSVQGLYYRLGAEYFITQDKKNPQMGYYTGLRVGYSPYSQTVNSFIIKGNDDLVSTSSLPEHKAQAFWLEPLVGARVQIMETPLYIDASLRMKIRAYSSNDYGITPLQIPGFGNDHNGLGIGVNWSIGYVLPF